MTTCQLEKRRGKQTGDNRLQIPDTTEYILHTIVVGTRYRKRTAGVHSPSSRQSIPEKRVLMIDSGWRPQRRDLISDGGNVTCQTPMFHDGRLANARPSRYWRSAMMGDRAAIQMLIRFEIQDRGAPVLHLHAVGPANPGLPVLFTRYCASEFCISCNSPPFTDIFPS